MKLKAKLGENLTDKEFIKLILEEREKQEFPAVKSRAKNKVSDEKSVTGDTSRYIRADKKRQIIAKTNGKCSYPNCNFPYEIFHLTHRYSESESHDSIIPLCKIHHEFMHNGLVKNERMSVKYWTLNLQSELTKEDVLWRKYRYGSEGGGSA